MSPKEDSEDLYVISCSRSESTLTTPNATVLLSPPIDVTPFLDDIGWIDLIGRLSFTTFGLLCGLINNFQFEYEVRSGINGMNVCPLSYPVASSLVGISLFCL